MVYVCDDYVVVRYRVCIVWCIYSSMCGIFYGEDVVKYGEYVCTVCVLSYVYVVWYVYVGTEVTTEERESKIL